jgi:hypothetical protein
MSGRAEAPIHLSKRAVVVRRDYYKQFIDDQAMVKWISFKPFEKL